MPIIKCKMCGGDIQLAEDKTFGTCEYCGSTMTLPRVSDEQRAVAFNRGNHFRRAGEFDKALGVYEHIVADDDTDAEAHWCCALCRFGIEYVEDPATYEWLPTCHRASFDSFLEDVDYLAALEHSDGITRRQYQKDAAKIAEVQRGILATSQNTEPYDVFISYKELDANGERTRDSILAQEIYYRLTEKGCRVFFSRISLEDVPGTQYEPYIFAALNSAKVMVVVGTSAENLNAVWVKNEWSRFLAMMRKDRSKLLIPCYRDMDPYDLPEQLSVLMSYDMGKIGFIQDLIRGVDKVLSAEKKEETVRETVKETVVVQQSDDSAARITAAMDRGFMALEDGEWNKAVSFFDQVLSLDAKNARAYYGMALAKAQCKDASAFIDKLCAFAPKSETIELPVDEEHIRKAAEKYTVPGYLSSEEIKKLYDYKPSYQSTERAQKQLNENARSSFEKNRDLTRARQFATDEVMAELDQLQKALFERLDSSTEAAAQNAREAKAQAEKEYKRFLESKDKLVEEKKRDAEAKREKDYQFALQRFKQANGIEAYQNAKPLFFKLSSYKDSAKMAKRCEEEAARIEREEALKARRLAEQVRVSSEKSAQKRKWITAIITAIVIACAIFAIVLTTVFIPKQKYNKAIAEMNKGDFEEAYALLREIGRNDVITSSKYDRAASLQDSGDYEAAYIMLKGLDYKDSAQKRSAIKKILLSKAQVGSYVYFGLYEQDNNSLNGKEDIEWLVLDKNDDKALVISRYALDCRQYNKYFAPVTWETCVLRKWLNEEFMNSAFSAEEQAMIPKMTVTADKNPAVSTSPGNDTTDQVFLLSIKEAKQYFGSDDKRKCTPTAYAVAQGAWASASDNMEGNPCWWWLRSPGVPGAAGVKSDGSIDAFGHATANVKARYGSVVDDGDAAVRPVLWIEFGA